MLKGCVVRNVARFLVAFFANALILLEGDFEALVEIVFEGALMGSLEGADTTRQDNRRALPIALGDCIVCFVSVGRISPAAPHHHFKISSLSLDRASLTRLLFKPHHKTTFRHILQTHCEHCQTRFACRFVRHLSDTFHR